MAYLFDTDAIAEKSAIKTFFTDLAQALTPGKGKIL
jgi:hypothetical protein